MPDLLASVTEANEYFTTRLFAEKWENASDKEKYGALLMATRKINNIPFRGVKYEDGQDNAFPRCYLKPINRRHPYRDDFLPGFYCDTDVPQDVKNACCEEALAILETGNSERAKLQREGIQTASFGKVSEQYKPGAGRGLLSFEAQDFLRPWTIKAVGL